jgi:hypothetical protein
MIGRHLLALANAVERNTAVEIPRAAGQQQPWWTGCRRAHTSFNNPALTADLKNMTITPSSGCRPLTAAVKTAGTCKTCWASPKGDKAANTHNPAAQLPVLTPVGLMFTLDRVMGPLVDYGMFFANLMLAARGTNRHLPQAAGTAFQIILPHIGAGHNRCWCAAWLGYADRQRWSMQHRTPRVATDFATWLEWSPLSGQRCWLLGEISGCLVWIISAPVAPFAIFSFFRINFFS